MLGLFIFSLLWVLMGNYNSSSSICLLVSCLCLVLVVFMYYFSYSLFRKLWDINWCNKFCVFSKCYNRWFNICFYKYCISYCYMYYNFSRCFSKWFNKIYFLSKLSVFSSIKVFLFNFFSLFLFSSW